jgi:Domain of unknown function (DUF4136)
MRILKAMVGISLLFIVAGTANAQKVSVDYNHQANFSNYKTYMWIHRPHYRPDPLMEQRAVEAINAALTAKGWREVPAGADVAVAAHFATHREHTLETFYDGFGGGWHWHFGPGFGTAVTTVHTYEIGSLVVDLFDAQSKDLIWRGVATDTFSQNPQKDTKKLEKAVDKLFSHFPPH